MRVLRITEMARELGVSVEWLREAEKKGKIPPARRDINGWRVYSEQDIEEIRSRLFPS